MRVARIKLKDGTELIARGQYIYASDLNQHLLEGKQFVSIGDMNIRIDSIEWVRVADEETENCIAEEQLGETE